jgi:hypothetical protein
MKKTALAFQLFFLLIYFNSYSQTLSARKTDIEKDGFKGKVFQAITNERLLAKYDEHGKKTEEITIQRLAGQDDEEDVKSTFTFDDKGNVVEKHDYRTDSEVNVLTTYKYDAAGNRIEEKSHETNIVSTYEYDGFGNMIKKNVFDSLGQVINKYTFKYDEKGNMIEKVEYPYPNQPSRFSKNTYKYDEKGNMIEINLNNGAGSSFNSKTILKYDDKGGIIEQNRYNAGGKLDKTLSTQYEYDKNGNWTKKTTSAKKSATSVTNRRIDYYFQ